MSKNTMKKNKKYQITTLDPYIPKNENNFKSILIELAPNQKKHDLLLETIHTFNKACNTISHIAYKNKCYERECLHQQAYKHIREKYELPSQMTNCTITKVLKTYNKPPYNKPITFKPYKAIIYDSQNLKWKKESIITIQTIKGTIKVHIKLDPNKKYPKQEYQSEKTLTYENNTFHIRFLIKNPSQQKTQKYQTTTLKQYTTRKK